MLTRDLRDAIARALAAAGLAPADPGLRPTGTPGQYASSVAPWASTGEPRSRWPPRWRPSPGSHRPRSPAPATSPSRSPPRPSPRVPERIAAAGPAAAASDALRGVTVPAPPAGDPLAAARLGRGTAALAARLTARLAAAAGATVAHPAHPERARGDSPAAPDLAAAVAYAGPDAVTVRAGQRGAGTAVPDRPGGNRAACAGEPRLCCEVRARPRRVRGALGSHPPTQRRRPRRARPPNRRSWRCSTRCPGSRNGSPPRRAVAGPTSSPGTWRNWPASPSPR